MKVKRLATLLALCLCFGLLAVHAGAVTGDVEINEANFPDATFRSYVSSNFDTDGNGVLSGDETGAVTSINIQYKAVSSLKGIEYFSALTSLGLAGNNLTSLDVSKNTALDWLVCDGNLLTELDVSKNTALTYLSCANNQLTSLDVSKNTALTDLYCEGNLLIGLDVRKNTALEFLWCDYNQLTSLDVSNNSALKGLYCSNNAYEIQLTGNRTFTLSSLLGFKPAKASNWVGGTVTNGVLTVESGVQKVTYTYDCGNGKTATFTLVIVDTPLEITKQPTTQKVKAGSTAKFKVTTSGDGLTYQWQYKASSSGSWKNCTATGNKTATLKVSATTGKSSYYYRCRITDSAGNALYSNTVRLYVLGIKTQPTTQKVKAGTTATFTVSATGSNKTYQWQYKTSSDGSWKNCTATGNKSATIKVDATTSKSSYYYRCKITDSASNVVYTNTVRLYVLGIKTQPVSQTVAKGTTVKFTVSATGLNKTYQWQYRTSSSGIWKNATASGNQTATLTLTATAARNGYQYRCMVKDSAGNTVYSNAATLKLK